jgi:regulator of nucleoside diphosphate kinase
LPSELYITQADKLRLKKLISDKLYDEATTGRSLSMLEREIRKAQEVDAKQLGPDVVTMHSKTLLSLDGEEVEVSLVYPQESNWLEQRLSVLSPIGTAILGYSEGDKIEWETPSGKTTIEIEKILYQPEAAGDYDL